MRDRIGDNWCESATICSKRPIRRQPGDGGAISPFRIVRWRGRTAGLPSNGATNRRSDAMWAMLTAAKEPRSIAHQREARGDALSAMIGILTLATLRLLLPPRRAIRIGRPCPRLFDLTVPAHRATRRDLPDMVSRSLAVQEAWASVALFRNPEPPSALRLARSYYSDADAC
jgi:hypothetical protein